MRYESPLSTIKKVAAFLGQPLPDNPSDIKAHLIGLDATRLEVAEKRADWLQLLQEKKSQMLHPKDKDFTELDRRIMLNASIAVIERDYNFLCSLEDLSTQRIELAKLILT